MGASLVRTAVIGGGNIGTLMAAEFAAGGHDVRVVTSAPYAWDHLIDVLDADGRKLMAGEVTLVANRIDQAAKGADYIWITHPTYMLAETAESLLPLIEDGQRIGVVPGACAEFFFAEHVRRGAVLFGLQRVHSIARLKERGRSVYMLGRKPELQVAALPSAETAAVAREVEGLFGIPTVSLPNYLVETLTPSNPILHTARIRELFRDWRPGVAYSCNIPFYEEWDDASSALLLACDGELQCVCRAVERRTGLDLSLAKPLREHYESSDAESMTAKISGIPAFRGIGSPMREEAPGKWVPDFSSRYFRADFAFGLKAIRDIAGLFGVAVPSMDEVLEWYASASGDPALFQGVPHSVEQFSAIYA